MKPVPHFSFQNIGSVRCLDDGCLADGDAAIT